MLKPSAIRELGELEETRLELEQEEQELELRAIFESSERALRVALESARIGIRKGERSSKQ